MTIETRKKIDELIKGDEGVFAKELEEAQSKEEFIAAFSAHGIELTSEDADELLKETLSDEELSEEALEDVAGGMSFLAAVKLGWGIGTRVGMVGRMVYDNYKYGNPYKNYNWNNVKTGKFW